MHRNLFALSFGFAALILAAQNAHAEGAKCGTRETIVTQLQQRFGETPRGTGTSANETVLEIFAADSGSWTMVVTVPGGPSCLVASGRDFQIASAEQGF